MMVGQTDFGDSTVRKHKDTDTGVSTAFDKTIKQSKEEKKERHFTPVSLDTTEEKQGIRPISDAAFSRPQTGSISGDKSGQKQTTETPSALAATEPAAENPVPVLQDHSLQKPARQEIRPITQTVVDVNESTAQNISTRRSRNKKSEGEIRRGSFGGNSGRTKPKDNDSSGQFRGNYEDYLSAPDFDYYSSMGADLENPSYREAGGCAYIFGWRPGAKEVKNIVTFSRDHADMIRLDQGENYSAVGDFRYTFMYDDEVDIYNYLLAKEGEHAAQSYLDYLEEELNRRYANTMGEVIRGTDNAVVRAMLTGGTAMASGFDQFGQGVQQAFSREKIPKSTLQFTSEYIRNDLAEDENVMGMLAYDAVSGISGMAPSILVSALLGPGVGAAMQGVSSVGNAYGSALDSGYSEEQATSYAALIGVSEAALQYALGGISKMGGLSSKTLLAKVEAIDNGLLRAAAAMGIKGLSEVSEEELQLILEPLYRTILLGEEYDAPTSEEMIYSAILSFITTGVLEGDSIISYAGGRKTRPNSIDSSDMDSSELDFDAYSDFRDDGADSMNDYENTATQGQTIYTREYETRSEINDSLPLSGMDPSELDFDPYAMFYGDAADSTDNHENTAAQSQTVVDESEYEKLSKEDSLFGLQIDPEHDTIEERDPGDIDMNSDNIDTEPNSGDIDQETKKPLSEQEESAMLGEIILDMGGMPKPKQLEAMGMDDATARGIQSLVLMSTQEDPIARSAVEAMIDYTDAQERLEMQQMGDAAVNDEAAFPAQDIDESSPENEITGVDENADWDAETFTNVYGDVIRDGSHMENGKPKPNVTYQTGEHDYIYQTNENGLIVRAVAKILKEKIHIGRLAHNPNTYGKLPTDESGHLFADRFGGSAQLDNLVSQAKRVNREEYFAIESEWAAALKQGEEVSVNIDIIYSNGNVRPDAFVVRYTMNGKKFSKTIQNQEVIS